MFGGAISRFYGAQPQAATLAELLATDGVECAGVLGSLSSAAAQPASGQPAGRVRPVWARPMRAICSRPPDTTRTPRSI